MNLGLTGKVALITGGSRGLGKAMAAALADVVAFLCSERASWITGACVNIDCGQSRSLI